jgi:hypothetical protein
MLKFYYRDHDSNGSRIRVWRSDWAGDQFNIVDREQFDNIVTALAEFSIVMIDAEGQEEDA